MTTLTRTFSNWKLLFASLLTIVFGVSAIYASNSSTISDAGYKLEAALFDCQRSEDSKAASKLELVQVAKNDTQSACHCPFSTTVLTPFSNTQLIDVINVQSTSLALYNDVQLGKIHNTTEQPFRPPIA